MRYYSEEDVSEMLAKEFDEACSYSKPYSGVKMSDYHSIEIPQTDWHTGTPTEEGLYVVFNEHLCYDIVEVKPWTTLHGVVAYQKIEPYKEENNG